MVAAVPPETSLTTADDHVHLAAPSQSFPTNELVGIVLGGDSPMACVCTRAEGRHPTPAGLPRSEFQSRIRISHREKEKSIPLPAFMVTTDAHRFWRGPSPLVPTGEGSEVLQLDPLTTGNEFGGALPLMHIIIPKPCRPEGPGVGC